VQIVLLHYFLGIALRYFFDAFDACGNVKLAGRSSETPLPLSGLARAYRDIRLRRRVFSAEWTGRQGAWVRASAARSVTRE